MCSSVNEVACHAIPNDRPLLDGDLVSFDVSVFLKARGQKTDLFERHALSVCLWQTFVVVLSLFRDDGLDLKGSE